MKFLFPEEGTSYQVEKSMETLKNAGWFGKGPGEGSVKYELPDAHTDFIMAVFLRLSREKSAENLPDI